LEVFPYKGRLRQRSVLADSNIIAFCQCTKPVQQ
jgi:hypothetical protein